VAREFFRLEQFLGVVVFVPEPLVVDPVHHGQALAAVDGLAGRVGRLWHWRAAAERGEMPMDTLAQLEKHVARLRRCRRCRTMRSRPVPGPAVASRVMIVGQAPGEHEPDAGRPFAWSAGKTPFGWFSIHCGMDEAAVRSAVYFAAVCRCFPGKESNGSDREPSAAESAKCAPWLEAEFEMLRPRLVIPVGKLAMGLFLGNYGKLVDVVGQQFRVTRPHRSEHACRAS